MICRLDSNTFGEGKGRTKKLAKKVAAHKVLMKLTELMRDSKPSDGQDTTDVFDSNALRTMLTTTIRNKQQPKLTEVVQNIRNRNGSKWSLLSVSD